MNRLFTKKIVPLCVWIFAGLPVFFVSNTTAQTAVEINTGNPQAPLYAVGPVYMSSTLFYKYSRYAYLYTQDELAAAGITNGSVITSLAWMKSTANETIGSGTFDIYMKNSTTAAYSNATETWTNLSSGADLVYQNMAQTIPVTTSPEYIEFPLNTPFTYTGGSIEILAQWQIEPEAGQGLATGSFEWVNTSVTDRIYGKGGTSLAGIESMSSTQNNTNINDMRPVIQITFNSGAPCVSPPDAGTTSVSVSGAVCEGISVSLGLINNSFGGGQTYQWQHSDDGISYTELSASLWMPAFTFTPAASAWYRCKVECAAGDAVFSNPVQVVVNPIPLVDLGDNQMICDGNDMLLDAVNPGSSYLWNDGSTDQTLTAGTAGTYWVTVTSAQGCVASDTVDVGLASSPEVNLGNDTSICNGEVVDLDAGNAGASYSWSNGAGTQTISVSAGGQYSVTVTNAEGCSSTDDIQISVLPAASGSFSAVPGTNPLSFTFTANATNAEQYVWDFGDGNSGSGSTVQHDYSAGGTYIVLLHLVDGCGDTTTVQQTITTQPVGIYDVISSADIKLYPNPANRFAIIDNSGTAPIKSVTVTDALGRMIYTKQNTTKSQIITMDLKGWSTGVYTVSIFTEEGQVVSMKLIVAR